MDRLDFEQAILEMIFDVGYDELTPATVAYFLKVPINAAKAMLNELINDGVLELESDPEGRFFYVLPIPVRPSERVLSRTRQFRATHGVGGVPLLPQDAPPPQPTQLTPPPLPEAYTLPETTWDEELDEEHTALVLASEPHHHLMLVEDRNPSVAMLLSCLWPGLGQVYNGQPGKGLLLFFTSAFLWFAYLLGWVVIIYSVIDAGIVAGRLNEIEKERKQRYLPAG